MKRGFALLAVLWLVVALAGLIATVLSGTRIGLERSHSRVAHLRGYWAAEGCLAAMTERIETALAAGERLATTTEPTRIAFAGGAECVVAAVDPSARNDSAFSDGRVNLNAVPDSLALQIPGITADVVRTLEDARRWGRPIVSLEELLYRVPRSARAGLMDHYRELTQSVSFRPSSLVLESRGAVPGQPGSALVELHVAAVGSRLAVLHRRVS